MWNVLVCLPLPFSLEARLLEKNELYNVHYYDEAQVQAHGPLTGVRLESIVASGNFHAILCSICNRMTESVIEKAGPSLQVISTMSVGLDHINLEAAKAKSILVGHTPDVLTPAMAELTITLMLTALRRIPEAITAAKSTWTRENAWNANWLLGRQICDSVVGILGLGRVGSALITRLIPFAPSKIIYHSRKSRYAGANDSAVKVECSSSLEEMLGQIDILIISCALTESTKGLLNRSAFSIMKKGCVLVNTARGPIVDSEALMDALDKGIVSYAALDVTDPEPLPKDHPLFHDYNNRVIIVPHIGSATTDARRKMALLSIQHIQEGLAQGFVSHSAL